MGRVDDAGYYICDAVGNPAYREHVPGKRIPYSDTIANSPPVSYERGRRIDVLGRNGFPYRGQNVKQEDLY